MTSMNQQWRLVRRPQGTIQPGDFTWHEIPVRPLEEGEVLVRQLYLSLDPTNRVWAATDSYLPAVAVGDVMRGVGVGRVEDSRHPGFRTGELVQGLLGWQRFEISSGRGLTRVPSLPGVEPAMFLHVLGHIGLTAWAGVLQVGRLQSGETMVVTAAAGAVGSIAGQIGKIRGGRVIGVAGSDEKCDWLTRDLGFDGAINYKTQPVRARLQALCPDGIDVQFENVGGALLDAALAHLKIGGRVALCGLIAGYAAATAPPGIANLHYLVSRRARIEGFLVSDFASRAREAYGELHGWLTEGRLKVRFTIVDGLGEAPAALNRLFDGSHDGKLLVRID
jgi:NADPH-dependent curcumin reductase CurA